MTDGYDELDRLLEKARTHQPQTLAGLLVWARTMQWDAVTPDQRHCPLADADWQEKQVRSFVAVLEEMAVRS